MGLLKCCTNTDGEKPIYLSYKKSAEHSIEIFLIQEDKSFSCNLDEKKDSVVEGSKTLNVSAKDYLLQLINVFGIKTENSKNLFEVKDNFLFWKQEFPGKNVLGVKGKFELEVISFSSGVETILNLNVEEIESLSREKIVLSQEKTDLEKDLNEAKELAATSIEMKHNFEQKVYTKFLETLRPKTQRNSELVAELDALKKRMADPMSDSDTSEPELLNDNNVSKSEEEEDCFDIDTDVDDEESSDEDVKFICQKRKFNGEARPLKLLCSNDSFDLDMSMEEDLKQVFKNRMSQTTIKEKIIEKTPEKKVEENSEKSSPLSCDDAAMKAPSDASPLTAPSDASPLPTPSDASALTSSSDASKPGSILNEFF